MRECLLTPIRRCLLQWLINRPSLNIYINNIWKLNFDFYQCFQPLRWRNRAFKVYFCVIIMLAPEMVNEHICVYKYHKKWFQLKSIIFIYGPTIRILVEENLSTTVQKNAGDMNIPYMTDYRYSKAIGKMKKLENLIRHELTKKIATFTKLYTHHW